jgi:hypothetical protein
LKRNNPKLSAEHKKDCNTAFILAKGYTASRGSVGSINMTEDGNSQRKQTRTLELKILLKAAVVYRVNM